MRDTEQPPKREFGLRATHGYVRTWPFVSVNIILNVPNGNVGFSAENGHLGFWRRKVV
jgi:hypothetical protein